MSARCARCDFAAVADGPTLAVHADEAGHPLCAVCCRSLAELERQTCATCVANTRADLADVTRLWPQLRAELGHPSTQRYDVTGRSSEPPMPGGDALVMLAGGNAQIHAPRTFVDDAGRRQLEPSLARYTSGDDPESVAVTLASWEDDWRHVRGERPSMLDASAGDRQARVLEAAAGYLGARLGWAAAHHPAFDEFAGDLARLVSRLASVTHTADAGVVGVRCLSCSARLERAVTRRGLADHYECPRCGRRYGETDYRLALRAHMDRRRADAQGAVEAGMGWAKPWQVAALLGLPVRTVRTWYARQVIGSRCDVASRSIEVDFADAQAAAGDCSEGVA